ncbi:MAG: 5-formyltetrahydrofolate cyclo-ligase [Prevotella sp.]|nr:5-formyltetrahydrofolate cyclo-ligase [Prevotella sp.]
MTKPKLRKYIRSLIREYSAEQLEELSLPIVDSILSHPMVKKTDTILLYHSLPDEVSTHSLLNELRKQGKRILLPQVISNTEMRILEYKDTASLTKGAYGIWEPQAHNSSHSQDVSKDYMIPQLAIIPGRAFDKEGHRLGRGKGYYDRLMSQYANIYHTSVYKIGVCFHFQLLESIPHDNFDVTMDEVIY